MKQTASKSKQVPRERSASTAASRTRIAIAKDSERPVVLVTAGPTHEAIDSVRYIANRSSGKLGMAIAQAAADRGWRVILLLGPVGGRAAPEHRLIQTHSFVSTADLQKLLSKHQSSVDALIMAAAVADYRPAAPMLKGKLRREAGPMVLHLEPTPDLLAAASARRKQSQYQQVMIGFALENKRELLASAQGKLARKGVDAIVANELVTMDSDSISAQLMCVTGEVYKTPRLMAKAKFGAWLIGHTEELLMIMLAGASDAPKSEKTSAAGIKKSHAKACKCIACA